MLKVMFKTEITPIRIKPTLALFLSAFKLVPGVLAAYISILLRCQRSTRKSIVESIIESYAFPKIIPMPTEYVATTIATGVDAGANATKRVIAMKSPATEHQLQRTLKAAGKVVDPLVRVAIARTTMPTGIAGFVDLNTVHPAIEMNEHSAPAYLNVRFRSEIAFKFCGVIGTPIGAL